MAVNDILYGTTVYGGKKSWGTVFSVTPGGKEHVLYAFKAGKDGANPFARLLDYNGRLYGVTQGGGTTGWGTAFSLRL